MGDTTPYGVIEITRQFSRETAEIAVVLSHEIVHARMHDPFAMPAKYSTGRRLFFHGEEEIAHIKSLWTAVVLWPNHHSVWSVLKAQWLLEPWFYIAVVPQCIVSLVLLVAMGFALFKGSKERFNKIHVQT